MTVVSITFLILVGAIVPIAALLGKRALDRGLDLPKLPFYIESIVVQVVILAGALLVAHFEGFVVFARPEFHISHALLASAALASALAAAVLGWRLGSKSMRRRLAQIVPVTRDQRLVWIALSAAAAIGEETTYRGVLVSILQAMNLSWLTAAAIASILFGLAHTVQGWRSALIVALYGFVFHLLVLRTGALYAGMGVHFLYDWIAGWWIGGIVGSNRTAVVLAGEEQFEDRLADSR